jgi:hypothetical protein
MMDIWQKNAERLRQREKLVRLDKWLMNLYEVHPFRFHLLTIVIATTLLALALGLEALFDLLTKT